MLGSARFIRVDRWGLPTRGIAFGLGRAHTAVSLLRLRDGEWTEGGVSPRGTSCTEPVVAAVAPGGHFVVASTTVEKTKLPVFFWGGTF